MEVKKKKKLTEEEREEQQKKYRKKYYAEHKEYFKEANKKYRENNKDYYNDYNSWYYKHNKDYFYEKNKELREERLGLFLYAIELVEDKSIFYTGSTVDIKNRVIYHKDRYKLKELIDNKISYRVLYVNLLDLKLDIELNREDLFMLEQTLLNKLGNTDNKNNAINPEKMFEYQCFFDTLLFVVNDKFKIYEEKIFHKEGVV